MITFLLIYLTDVVHNDFKPANPMKLSLVKELVLGEDEEDDYQQFTMGAQLEADAEGNIYVLDPGNDRVVVFNQAGAFIREFGRSGEGPGEFQQPKEIAFDLSGRLNIFDLGSRKMSTFSKQGEFLGEKMLPRPVVSLSHPVFLKGGHILLSVVRLDQDGTQNFDLILYDENFKAVKTLANIPQPKKDWNKMGEPQFWVTFLKDIFEGVEKGIPLAASFNPETFAAVRTNQYKADIHHWDGKMRGGFDKKLKPRVFTREAKEVAYGKIWQSLCNSPFLNDNLTRSVFNKALEKTEVGETVRPIWEFTSMNGLVVFLVDYDSVKGQGSLEFFNESGKCVGQVAYEGTDEFLHGVGDQLYTLGSGPDDILIITRYRVDGLRSKPKQVSN